MRLSDAKIRNEKAGDKPRKMSDGSGLFLFIQAADKGGSKLWRLEYRYDGKPRTLSIGPYGLVSLKQARDARDDARRLLAKGVDPSAAKRAKKEAHRVATEGSFQSVAERWLESMRSKVAPITLSARERPLRHFIFPRIGNRPIGEIEPPELLAALRAMYGTGASKQRRYSVRRVRGYLGRIFRFGIAEGLCKRDPAADIRDALDEAPRAKNREALQFSDLPAFFARLKASKADGITKDYLLFVLYTWARPGEVRFARWSEMENLEGDLPIWRIPGERKKERHEFLCPLSPQALEVLKRAKKRAGDSEFVFPVPTNKEGVLSENRGVNALRDMGFATATVHGFRSLASTACNEAGLDGDLVESQLAHAQGAIRRTYNRAKYLQARLKLVTTWGEMVQTQKKFGDLIG